MIPNGKSSVYVEEAHNHVDEKCIYVKIKKKRKKKRRAKNISKRKKKYIPHRKKIESNKKTENQLR